MGDTPPSCSDTPLKQPDTGGQGSSLPIRSTPEVASGLGPIKVAGLLVIGVGRQLPAMPLALIADGRKRDTSTPPWDDRGSGIRISCG